MPLGPSWFGYNDGARVLKDGPWHSRPFQMAVARLAPSTIRFPGGTVANSWDWRNGCNDATAGCSAGNPGPSKLEDFAATINATGASALLVLNMLTDNLNSQLAFLRRAHQLGIPVVGVELGNEFYTALPEHVKWFPDGTAYGRLCARWIRAITAAFPRLPLAVVGTPAVPAVKTRRVEWNKLLFAEVRFASART